MHLNFKERAPAVPLGVSIAVRVSSDVVTVILHCTREILELQ
jgi:hypothetical protein